jgi:hypothetical protein
VRQASVTHGPASPSLLCTTARNRTVVHDTVTDPPGNRMVHVRTRSTLSAGRHVARSSDWQRG